MYLGFENLLLLKNYHELKELKVTRGFFLWFWRSEVLKIKVHMAVFLLETQGETLFPCLY